MDLIKQKIEWMDEVVRRLFRENQAGFWGIYSKLSTDELKNELYRKKKYEDYVASLYILQWIYQRWTFLNIRSFDENNAEWTHAASDLLLSELNAEITSTVDRKKLNLSIGSHVIGTDFEIDWLCPKTDLVFYYFVPEDPSLCGWEKDVQVELSRCKDIFAENGYIYYDLRPAIKDNWEISEKYTQSISLFIKQDRLNEVCKLLKINCFGELEYL